MVGASVSWTVTLKWTGEFAPSVQTTVVVPIGKNAPEAGLQVTMPQLLGVAVELVVGSA
jgi:hypothetical protein